MPERTPQGEWMDTGRVRIRSRWFGFAVVEVERDRMVYEAGTVGTQHEIRWFRMKRGEWTAVTWPADEWRG